jgi:hypothetical protein
MSDKSEYINPHLENTREYGSHKNTAIDLDINTLLNSIVCFITDL